MLQIVTKFAANGYNSHRSHPKNLKLILDDQRNHQKLPLKFQRLAAILRPCSKPPKMQYLQQINKK